MSALATTGLSENVWEDTPRLENRHEDREAFSPEELRLIGQHSEHWCHPLFAIAVHTGLREGVHAGEGRLRLHRKP